MDKISVLMNAVIFTITIFGFIASLNKKNQKKSKKIKQKKDIQNKKQNNHANKKSLEQNVLKHTKNILEQKKMEAKEYAEFLSNYSKDGYKDKKSYNNSQKLKNSKQSANKTQKNINISQQDVAKKIDDIIYNYEKDIKKQENYNKNVKNFPEYEHYDYSKEYMEEEFYFDLGKAVLYSEILQKPLSLRQTDFTKIL